MDCNFLAENTLACLDPALHGRYARCVAHADKVLGRYRKNFPQFTDHTLLHSMEVINLCNKLISSRIKKLNAGELYILLMAALLHDTGMGLSQAQFDLYTPEIPPLQAYRESHPGKPLPDMIREFHNDLSARFILHHCKAFEIPDETFAWAVAQVGRGHRKTDLMDRKEYPAAFRLLSGDMANLAYLSAVLRLADEMDISASRNLLLQYAGFVPEDARSVMEFQKHRSIRRAELEDGCFAVHASTDDQLEFDELTQLCRKVRETMEECNRVALDAAGEPLPAQSVRPDIRFTGGSQPLSVLVRRDGARLSLYLSGRVDTLTAPMLEQKLASSLAASISLLEMDLASVAYISSAGLRVLLGAKKKMDRQSGSLTLRGASPELMGVFHMSGFDTILDFAP